MKNTNYRGSATTRKMVEEQLIAKFGQEEAKNYVPELNCRTYKSWQAEGYQVKKNEKAIKSITFVVVKDGAGDAVNTYPKTVNLFYIKQVEKITA